MHGWKFSLVNDILELKNNKEYKEVDYLEWLPWTEEIFRDYAPEIEPGTSN